MNEYTIKKIIDILVRYENKEILGSWALNEISSIVRNDADGEFKKALKEAKRK